MQVFPMGQLGLLTGEELEGRMRGESGAWDVEGLRSVVRADHGYKDASPQLAWLISVMAVGAPAPDSRHTSGHDTCRVMLF